MVLYWPEHKHPAHTYQTWNITQGFLKHKTVMSVPSFKMLALKMQSLMQHNGIKEVVTDIF